MMHESRSILSRHASRLLAAALLLALAVAAAPGPPLLAASAVQRGFDTPEEAAAAFVEAIKAGDRKALIEILGPEGAPLLSSGDAVADRDLGQRFLAAYEQAHRFEGGGGKVVLHVGLDDFRFPIPLVPTGVTWRFDTAAGKEEILNRSIGRNELAAIQVCLAYVDAQREYYSRDRNADGLREYAQRFASTPGKHDGLYWPTQPDETPSPLGLLVATARAEGYGPGRGGSPVPYHGYYYRILTGQGAEAPGGPYSYLAHGRMIGGFALVAFPARYGVSGVMTFIVNHDGVVHQKDLGPSTAAVARAMKEFNPDSTWSKV
jgi:hypothetical protein